MTTPAPTGGTGGSAEFALADHMEALGRVADEDERTWLFRVLDAYFSPPRLDRLLPILEKMEDYRIFELKPEDRGAALRRLQKRAASITPYSTPEQTTKLFQRIEARHEKRIGEAAKSGDLGDLEGVMDSSLTASKLAMWLVGRGLQSVDHLSLVRTNLETIFVGEKPLLGPALSSGDDRVLRLLEGMDIVGQVVLLAYLTDHLQELSPQFRHVFGRTNHVKEVFDGTFAQTISLLVEKLPKTDLAGELHRVSTEYDGIVPAVVFDAPTVLKSVNIMIMNANGAAHGLHRYPPLQLTPEAS
jgi:hypothetical protein